MFYCKKCSDTVEIIKNTNLSIEDKIIEILNIDEFIDIFTADLEAKKNKYINSDVQYSINWSESDLDKIDIKKLGKIINNDMNSEEIKIELVNMYQRIVKSQKNISTFYLSCTNCATTYFLEPGIIIDSINFEKNAVINNDDSAIRIKDQTLLRTKDFICPNQKCINNTKKTDQPVLIDKEAVFYRQGKEYNIKYICCQCNTQWGT